MLVKPGLCDMRHRAGSNYEVTVDVRGSSQETLRHKGCLAVCLWSLYLSIPVEMRVRHEERKIPKPAHSGSLFPNSVPGEVECE